MHKNYIKCTISGKYLVNLQQLPPMQCPDTVNKLVQDIHLNFYYILNMMLLDCILICNPEVPKTLFFIDLKKSSLGLLDETRLHILHTLDFILF